MKKSSFFFFFNPHVFVFLMWTIFKVLIGFVTTLLLFCVLVFGLEVCRISAPSKGSNLDPLHWKAKS